jgi:hypothetical protein
MRKISRLTLNVICINVGHNTTHYCMIDVRLLGTVNINRKFSIEQPSTASTQYKYNALLALIFQHITTRPNILSL